MFVPLSTKCKIKLWIKVEVTHFYTQRSWTNSHFKPWRPGWRHWLPSFKRSWYVCVCCCVWVEIKKPILFHASQLKYTGKKCWLRCVPRPGNKSAKPHNVWQKWNFLLQKKKGTPLSPTLYSFSPVLPSPSSFLPLTWTLTSFSDP